MGMSPDFLHNPTLYSFSIHDETGKMHTFDYITLSQLEDATLEPLPPGWCIVFLPISQYMH